MNKQKLYVIFFLILFYPGKFLIPAVAAVDEPTLSLELNSKEFKPEETVYIILDGYVNASVNVTISYKNYTIYRIDFDNITQQITTSYYLDGHASNGTYFITANCSFYNITIQKQFNVLRDDLPEPKEPPINAFRFMSFMIYTTNIKNQTLSDVNVTATNVFTSDVVQGFTNETGLVKLSILASSGQMIKLKLEHKHFEATYYFAISEGMIIHVQLKPKLTTFSIVTSGILILLIITLVIVYSILRKKQDSEPPGRLIV